MRSSLFSFRAGRRSPWRKAALGLGFLGLVVLAGRVPAYGESPADRERLERGEVVVADGPALGVGGGGGGGKGAGASVEAAVLVEAPVERVWEVMVDCARAPEFVPGLRECKVLESAPDHELIRHRVKTSGLLPEVTYTFRADYRRLERIDFQRTGGDLRELAGRWTLSPEGPRTLVRYAVHLDPGFLVPQWLVRRSLRHDLPELLRALRKRVAQL
jgi:coenzyme Q-binding protein COQ10